MILPILPYGKEILRKEAASVNVNDDIGLLIEDMFDTMYAASGVGLAAPQIGKSLSLFVMDSRSIGDEEDDICREVFINPSIVDYGEERGSYEEGCLSIPGVRGNVERPLRIAIEYTNLHLQRRQKEFYGINARIIQHEYDHLKGKLFIDYLSASQRQLIKSKLEKIRKGIFNVSYDIQK